MVVVSVTDRGRWVVSVTGRQAESPVIVQHQLADIPSVCSTLCRRWPAGSAAGLQHSVAVGAMNLQ